MGCGEAGEVVRHPSYTEEDRICGSILCGMCYIRGWCYTWWLVLYSYLSVDIVHVIMSHTLLGSFWTPACRLVSAAGVGGTSLSELLREWVIVYLL
ncbi:hypothetical protein RHGRI_009857 [Rhododendron griersonianum]|uniref:Uncharacterized protein n=1 Tax=Rhododendron griersonianum TaxID=479676 RepID=A0AAV6KGC6_9ERIC|nr:hypothetical protein RHGRI_009857 [Rhododendron griersonianum]